MSLFKTLFPLKWPEMIRLYHHWLEHNLNRAVAARWVLQLLDADAMLALNAARSSISRFVEIGCGAAIPSIAIARLGRRDVSAFDVDLEMVRVARKMINLAGVDVALECRDFHYVRLCGGKDWIWIAAKPRGVHDKKRLLECIVKEGIKEKAGLALVPAYGPDPDQSAYRRGCEKLVCRLWNAGYGVTMQRLSPWFPLQGIVALQHGNRQGEETYKAARELSPGRLHQDGQKPLSQEPRNNNSQATPMIQKP
ncbi:MAG TPA: class I SAM-dependent methyltransferase [Candidatus Aminicenantes bacterium]|nr:class I SAM-dependent methyltransferase [Candidatus Aminicenantes bacterium]